MHIRSRGWIAVMTAALLATGACTAEVENEGELPEVNVEGGEAPNVDVNPVDADVNVSQDTQTVVTPDVDVSTSPAGEGR